MTQPVRQATPEDIEAILALRTEASQWLAAKGSDQWQWPPRIAGIKVGIAAGTVWVIEGSVGDVVATITVDNFADPEFWLPADQPDTALYAHQMIVARSHARQGLGSALLDFAGALAQGSGRRWVRLDAWATNKPLQDYYLTQGFQPVRITHYPHRGSGALFQRRADAS
jgi:GNAT superfamily N-acetyltransferase